jgi:hypothetical protein
VGQVRLLKKLAAFRLVQGLLPNVFDGVVDADVLGAFVQLAGLFDGLIHGLCGLLLGSCFGLKACLHRFPGKAFTTLQTV